MIGACSQLSQINARDGCRAARGETNAKLSHFQAVLLPHEGPNTVSLFTSWFQRSRCGSWGAGGSVPQDLTSAVSHNVGDEQATRMSKGTAVCEQLPQMARTAKLAIVTSRKIETAEGHGLRKQPVFCLILESETTEIRRCRRSLNGIGT